MMTMRWGRSLSAALLLMAVGCGDDGDGKEQPDDKGDQGDGDVSDGDQNDDNPGNEPSNSSLGKDLSPAEATALCQDLARGIDLEWTKEQDCTIGAVFFTADEAACEMLVQQCGAQPDDPADDESDEGDDCADAAEDLAGCNATVAEIRTCIQAFADNIQSLEKVTCDSAGTLNQSDLTTPPSVCAPVQEKCPDLFADEEEDEDSQNAERSVRGRFSVYRGR